MVAKTEQPTLFDPEPGSADLHRKSMSETHLDRLRQRNQETLAEILRHNVRPDQLSILAVRLNTLIEWVTGGDPDAAKGFEIQFETAMGQQLTKTLAHVNQARLLAPMPQPSTPAAPGLIIPGRPA